MELKYFEPNKPLNIIAKINGIKLTKKFFKIIILLNANNLKEEYHLKGFVVFKYPNHFVAFKIKNEVNIEKI